MAARKPGGRVEPQAPHNGPVTAPQLPALGPRGEGWFALQVALFALVALAGGFGPAWSGQSRIATDVVGTALIAAGGLLALRAVLDLRGNLTVFPRPIAGAQLVDTGAYALVRHPIYGGLIGAGFGWSVLTASLPAFLAAAVLAAFFELKSRREERWLAEELAGYDQYRLRTRRLVPWLY